YMPKFVRRYADLHGVMSKAVEAYSRDVREGRFPDDPTSYHLKPEMTSEVVRRRGLKAKGKRLR
ncbi:MAG: 3-methyl-2-oxobutanoate hydroxymethyltransferase, partial [Candidatus Aminicenantes bacterium]|nr:3-methyl-2-oxobutanoate hydroxymethyltransferase [Candidatus Aminicenantes bacterium]